MTAGVLALQGCVDPHLAMFRRLGVEAVKVRTVAELSNVDRLVMPGGESTTMLRLLAKTGLDSAIIDFAKQKPVWGVCAGSILAAREVTHPAQRSLGLIDIQATRNYYGSQLDSFKAAIEIPVLDASLDVDFIRAPLLAPLSPSVEVLASLRGQAVLLKQGNILASAFHTELGDNPALHRYFAGL